MSMREMIAVALYIRANQPVSEAHARLAWSCYDPEDPIRRSYLDMADTAIDALEDNGWSLRRRDEYNRELAAIAEWQNSARIVIDAANQFVMDCVTGDGNPVTIAQALIDSGFDDGKTLR